MSKVTLVSVSDSIHPNPHTREFDSVAAAAAAQGVSESTLRKYAKSGEGCRGSFVTIQPRERSAGYGMSVEDIMRHFLYLKSEKYIKSILKVEEVAE